MYVMMQNCKILTPLPTDAHTCSFWFLNSLLLNFLEPQIRVRSVKTSLFMAEIDTERIRTKPNLEIFVG